MLDQEEKIIKAQNKIVKIQYIVLIVLGFMIFDLITKMELTADLSLCNYGNLKGELRQLYPAVHLCYIECYFIKFTSLLTRRRWFWVSSIAT